MTVTVHVLPKVVAMWCSFAHTCISTSIQQYMAVVTLISTATLCTQNTYKTAVVTLTDYYQRSIDDFVLEDHKQYGPHAT